MATDVDQTQLMAFLRTKHNQYFAKVLELRDQVKGWLAYIPQTFPHYTRHTVEHSDEIVAQISKLLFKSGRKAPVISLTPTEAYILAAAAYLHDAGMVVSDSEKAMILESDEWKAWTTEGGGATRWQQIEAFRAGDQPEEPSSRHFLADVQARHLIAEFIRPSHHRRAAAVIAQHEVDLGLFAFRDRILREAIADVCVAHGLRQHELEDPERYPDFCQIQGEDVNLRFLAIILRLGDLLDLTHDRACPWLMNAASPLPPTSFAHWSQYQRITRRATAPDRITITAKCQTQDEHRVLQDWCQWIVDEVAQARTLMATASRHTNWTPPEASLNGPSPTIKIDPAPGAKYFWSEWKLELDNEAIFERLIHDLYDSPETFIRELIQNALDANRCQMYGQLKAEGIHPPEYPTEVEEERRLRYPVRIILENRQFENELSGEQETKQVLIVEDCGIGMDRDIIEHYFLQIGRTYYDTEEFRREYGFVPTSRFGLGFLSVFAVSDLVTVETFKPASRYEQKAFKLVLTGPRNYLLTERGERQTSGTRIEVVLREPLADDLTKLVSGWCRRVEFPVEIDNLGDSSTVTAERPDDFTYEVPDVTQDGFSFSVRSFPIERPGIEGELYVFSHTDDKGESWAALSWSRTKYPTLHPAASPPPVPAGLICAHGIATSEYNTYSSARARLDYRGRDTGPRIPISRTYSAGEMGSDPQVVSRWEELLTEHLATSARNEAPNGWKYRQSLLEGFPLPAFWKSRPDMVPLYQDSKMRLVSLDEILEMPGLVTIVKLTQILAAPDDGQAPIERFSGALSVLLADDLQYLSDSHRAAIFSGRLVTGVSWLDNDNLVLKWERSAEDPLFAGGSARPIGIAALPEVLTAGGPVHKTTDSVYDFLLLNSNHSFIQWLVRAKQACQHNLHGLSMAHFERVIALLRSPLEYEGMLSLPELTQYLDGWLDLHGLPADLRPPQITADMFGIWRNTSV